MEWLQHLNLTSYDVSVLLINLAIAVGLLECIKFLSGTLVNINAKDELAEKDNPAFGIGLAGLALAVIIVMTGVISGEASTSLMDESIAVLAYGITGIILMSLSRFIFDKVSMPNFSIGEEIKHRNNAAAIIDAGNVVATAIIVRAVMIWVDSDLVTGLLFVCAGYVLSQCILSIAATYRLFLYNRCHKACMQDALKEGNVAIAWRFTGIRLGIALAITATSGLVPYAEENILSMAGLWVVVSLVMMCLVSILAWLTEKIFLSGVNTRDEVDNQANVAVGVVQCTIHIAIGLLIATLMT